MTGVESPSGFGLPANLASTEPSQETTTSPAFADNVNAVQNARQAAYAKLDEASQRGQVVDVNMVRTIDMMYQHTLQGMALQRMKQFIEETAAIQSQSIPQMGEVAK